VLGIRVAENLLHDVEYAARVLRKNPRFTATAVLVLALGIGGNTAMFSVVRAVLLKPLDYRDPDRLARISGGATPTRFAEMKDGARSFTGIGAFTPQEPLSFAGGTEPESVNGVRVSGSFLEILGARPLLGRGFLPTDDSPNSAPAVMLSAELWRRRFNEDLRIAGKTAVLGAVPYTVVGVLPPRFQFPFPGMDVWMTKPEEWPPMPPASRPLSPPRARCWANRPPAESRVPAKDARRVNAPIPLKERAPFFISAKRVGVAPPEIRTSLSGSR